MLGSVVTLNWSLRLRGCDRMCRGRVQKQWKIENLAEGSPRGLWLARREVGFGKADRRSSEPPGQVSTGQLLSSSH